MFEYKISRLVSKVGKSGFSRAMIEILIARIVVRVGKYGF